MVVVQHLTGIGHRRKRWLETVVITTRSTVHDNKGRSLPHGVTIWDQRESFGVEPEFCVIFEAHEHAVNLIDHISTYRQCKMRTKQSRRGNLLNTSIGEITVKASDVKRRLSFVIPFVGALLNLIGQ